MAMLQKATPGSWPRVQHDVNSDSNLIALYPTSSKKKQDWGSIERQVIEEEEKETPDGDAALNKLVLECLAGMLRLFTMAIV